MPADFKSDGTVKLELVLTIEVMLSDFYLIRFDMSQQAVLIWTSHQ